jgi:hypothetical protein
MSSRRSAGDSDLRTELELLRACVGYDATALRAALDDPETDVGGFLDFAQKHRLGGFVDGALRRSGSWEMLAPGLRAASSAGAMFERARNERLVAELGRLDVLLGRAGIPVLFLKGPLLARRFYDGVGDRASTDLDLLVRPADVERAEALLLGDGYAPAYRILLSRRLSRHFAHHFEYRRDGLPLDLHWALQRHFTFAIDYERVWATSERVDLGGRPYAAVSSEYELVLQLLGILTDLQVGKAKLRAMVDVHRIVRAMEPTADWEAFCARRRRERLLRPVACALSLVFDVLDCRSEHPSLAAAVQRTLGALLPAPWDADAVAGSHPLSLEHKLRALRAYETPLLAAVTWWMVSLPFRLAVYGMPMPRRQGEPSK